MQQTVRLLGDLGERYGSEHRYHGLRSPAEAIKLLCVNYPALQKELVESHQHGVGYTLVQAETFLGYEDLHLPLGSNDLVLTPVIAGSGGGSATPILVGVGLVALSIVAAPLSAGFLGAGLGIGATAAPLAAAGGGFIAGTGGILTASMSIALGTIGTGLVLQGVANLLSPQPEIPSLNDQNKTAPGQNTNATGPQGVSRATSGQQSYAFSGPANTVGVGATVPLVYGKLLIGSHLISSRVEVSSESDPTGKFFEPPGPASIRINGEKVGNKFESLNGVRTRKYKDKEVRIGNYSNKRRQTTKVVKFDDTDKLKINDEIDDKAKGNDVRKNFQIFIEINKGLSRVLGDQTVPAFVTYEITIKKKHYDGESPIFCQARVTVQGLLRKSDKYKYCHALTYGVTGVEDSNTTLEPSIRIIDTDADAGQQLVVRGVGYNHFYKKSENETEDLSET
tara:strand:+ start:576 stop:1928 length:1353 start_codon:yes stop_codon:yes gene_type:complete